MIQALRADQTCLFNRCIFVSWSQTWWPHYGRVHTPELPPCCIPPNPPGSVVGMNGLVRMERRLSAWGCSQVGPSWSRGCHTDPPPLHQKPKPEKNPFSHPLSLLSSRFGDHLCYAIMHPFRPFGERYLCHIWLIVTQCYKESDNRGIDITVRSAEQSYNTPVPCFHLINLIVGSKHCHH